MMNPLIAFETCSSLKILSAVCRTLADECIAGIQADEERCRHWIEWSLALVTPLAVEIGYDKAAGLAYKAYREKRPIKEVVEEEGILSHERIEELLDPLNMI
jgi:fumarate hydratase class II